jgi:pantoate--beta-alanine ligase
MSSRNRYLDADERRRAPALHAVLVRVREELRAGARDFARLTAEARGALARAGFQPDYVEIRRQGDLAPADAAAAGEERIVLAAARLGRPRLIDNLFV